MTSRLKLRGYQRAAIDAVYAAWGSGMRRPAIELPTGMGKTVIFGTMADEWIGGTSWVQERPDGAVLVLVHRDELATQAAEKIHMINPDLHVGVVKAGRNDVDAQVIIGSVQTLARRNRLVQLPRIGLVIVDEAHHAAADSYIKILTHVGAFNGSAARPDGARHGRGALAVGVTATMSRNDSRGLGRVWQEIVYTRDIPYGIEHGHLTDVRGFAVTVDGLDLNTVARSGGDYREGSLGDALAESGAGAVIAQKYREHAPDRQGVLFAPTVATAHSIAEDFNSAGIPTAVVTGSTSREDRALAYKRVRAGDTQVLANCMVLTEGFDMPQLSCAVIARPTTSQALYVQMVGRVLRPYPNKTDALVLDVMGVSSRLKLASLADLSDRWPEPRDGESLTEAMLREQGELAEKAAAKERRRLSGKIASFEVDLFHASESVWLKTHKGVWFIPTRSATVFLWPDGVDDSGQETWKIGQCGVYDARGGQWLQGGLTQTYAMAIAEGVAGDLDPTVSNKTRSWRRTPVSDGQKVLAARYGIELERDGEPLRKGELSDLISVHIASRFLDRTVK